MFQSYKEYVGKKDGKYTYGYELTDSDFGTVSGIAVGFGISVIQEYAKRNLNVAKNLAVAFAWYSRQDPETSIENIIEYNKKYNPLFSQYEEDLQKYLLLL